VWCGLPGFYPSVSPDAAAAAPVDSSWTSIPSAKALGTGTLEIISAPAISPRPGWGLVAMATGLRPWGDVGGIVEGCLELNHHQCRAVSGQRNGLILW